MYLSYEMGLRTKQYAVTYKGVFTSPFDYDMDMCLVHLAGLMESARLQISEEQKGAISRFEELKRRGGIDVSCLPEEFSYQIESLERIFTPQKLSQL